MGPKNAFFQNVHFCCPNWVGGAWYGIFLIREKRGLDKTFWACKKKFHWSLVIWMAKINQQKDYSLTTQVNWPIWRNILYKVCLKSITNCSIFLNKSCRKFFWEIICNPKEMAAKCIKYFKTFSTLSFWFFMFPP